VTNRHAGPCGVCGAPILRSGHDGYVHDAPLGELRVSATEAEAIHNDPPPPGVEMGRETYLHQPRP